MFSPPGKYDLLAGPYPLAAASRRSSALRSSFRIGGYLCAEGATDGRPGGGEAGLLARMLALMAAGRGSAFGQYQTVQNYGKRCNQDA